MSPLGRLHQAHTLWDQTPCLVPAKGTDGTQNMALYRLLQWAGWVTEACACPLVLDGGERRGEEAKAPRGTAQPPRAPDQSDSDEGARPLAAKARAE